MRRCWTRLLLRETHAKTSVNITSHPIKKLDNIKQWYWVLETWTSGWSIRVEDHTGEQLVYLVKQKSSYSVTRQCHCWASPEQLLARCTRTMYKMFTGAMSEMTKVVNNFMFTKKKATLYRLPVKNSVAVIHEWNRSRSLRVCWYLYSYISTWINFTM